MFSSGDIIALVAIAGSFLLLFVPIVALTTRRLIRDITQALADRKLEPDRLARELGGVREEIARLRERVDVLETGLLDLPSGEELERKLRAPERRED
jgi:hypothetical protein